MFSRKIIHSVLSVLVVASLLFGGGGFSPSFEPGVANAAPLGPTDETKVPHYFGPYPNWANSPLTVPNAVVEISSPTGTGAKAAASVAPDGTITGITVTNPGSGYTDTSTTVTITGSGTGTLANAVVMTSGSVTGITVDTPGAGYTSPSVTLSGGGGTGTLVQVGNQLSERAYATDNASNVFVVVPTPLPTGLLQSFQTLNQASAGGSFAPSAGLSFNAYVLRPTGVANEYLVVFDGGLFTVPALADPAVSEVANFTVPDVPVQAGDVLAFYGQGIPLDIGAGADILSYPAPAGPAQGSTITLGSAEFPLLAQARTYSFAASVIDTSAVVPLTNATVTAYGGVDAVTLSAIGSGYQMPTVEIDLPNAPDGVQATAHAVLATDGSGAIAAVVVDTAGSGYSQAPAVVIHDGTLFDPIAHTGEIATATATLSISAVVLDTFGAGYTSAPSVNFSDLTGTGTGATATAQVNAGTIASINVTNPGSGYLKVGMRKFIDDLPLLCYPNMLPTEPGGCPEGDPAAKFLPLAIPEAKTYGGIQADEYEIGLVQYRTSFSSDLKDPITGLPVGTLVRGYVQLETPANASFSEGFLLTNELLNGTKVPILDANGVQYKGVTSPQYLGPIIAATKNKPVRIVFRNLLPTGSDGDLFLPTDSTLMGSGMVPMDMMPPMDEGTVTDGVRNPLCSEYPKAMDCFKDSRATLHLHGGISPWISDGTAHQWITPAGEMTGWPEGVSVENVPDMAAAGCDGNSDGCQTFYYTNQQSARLLFYHDHSWGITRLNVYAGEAAGYLITDPTEQRLIKTAQNPTGVIPEDQIPLVIQDKTFVPDAAQLAMQDPTWDTARWGGMGNFWYHHVYMPAQNPGDPSGMSGYGRWMYGPWFWPPAANTVHGPIANPYYNMDPDGLDNIPGNADDWATPLAVPCNLDVPATWQYDTDPFCEPQQIPGTPNISVGMEQFNDTPVVNGVAYPKHTVDPKAYRLRILSAANDRFFNLQWYIADPTTGTLSEVALNPAELAAAQTDPNVFPTPDTTVSLPGPDWVQIGTEGGFLPAPVVVDGQQVTTWITDPTRFDVGNVDKHSLLLAPAERADVIVDFSQFAGKTLILYNDAPAAFPARVPSYDYYTGAPDLSPVGAPTILPGYGPNTRTIMQVNVAATTPATAFDLPGTTNDGLGRLQAAFRHNVNRTGAFESGQHPIIVGQAAYNSAYGTSFAASSNCNAPGSTLQQCDGLVRVNDTTTFGFNTLLAPTVKMSLPLQPKAIHDEMNATTFDEFGRMQANLGLEAQPPTPGQQNVTLYPFVNPATEIIDATNLPKANVTYDANGLPASDVKITPIANAADGTQIWRVTHNGVDTHPIHFHLYDVQLLNRVTWDNIIIPPDLTELGWKDTVRIAPLEDTIVALRPIIPEVPWELPNAIRMLNPMMPEGSTAMFNNVNAQGIPTAPIVNELVNFGWEYVYHCHILSHEEMDMMRPVSVALPPIKPDGLAATTAWVGGSLVVSLSWNDNSIAETSYVVQRSDDGGVTWLDVGTVTSPLDQANTTGVRTFDDTTAQPDTAYQYRVLALNEVGYYGAGGAYMNMTVKSTSDPLSVNTPVPPAVPAAPTNLAATAISAFQVNLTWTDNAADETGFNIERALAPNGIPGAFSLLATVGANVTSYSDMTVAQNTTYAYRVFAFHAGGSSAPSNVAIVTTPVPVPPPAAPTNLVAALLNGTGLRVRLTFRDNALNETGFVVERSDNGGAFAQIAALGPRANRGNVTYDDTTVVVGNTYAYRVAAVNAGGPSAYSNTVTISVSVPAAPSNFNVTAVIRNGTTATVTLSWTDNSNNETGFRIQRATNATFTAGLNTTTVRANVVSRVEIRNRNRDYYYRIQAYNAAGASAWVNATPFPIHTP